MAPKNTSELIGQLRALMGNEKYIPETINAYIIPGKDAHYSEIIADCDKFLAFISGFTGSAGTAVVTHKKALLWTDGRYYLQASQELDSNWTLMKAGLHSTPTVEVWLAKNVSSGSNVGIDSNLCTHHMLKVLKTELDVVGVKVVTVGLNLVKMLWTHRPPRIANPVVPLELEFSGQTVGEKLTNVREQMREKKAQFLVVTALDEVAWLLNLRGSDIEYNPVFFSYVTVQNDTFTIFLSPKEDSDEIRQHLTKEAGKTYGIKPYSEIMNHLKEIESNLHGLVWFSQNASCALTGLVPEKSLLTEVTPIALLKLVKNSTEIKGMKNAHLLDGAALCCYLSWLEKKITSEKITEISGAEKLEEFRLHQNNYIGPSFFTVSAVGPHGAIIHYRSQPDTDIAISTDSLYLCDSGGQYKNGTTDVTRTVHFGTPTKLEKECFTRILKGQISLATTIFPSKTKGSCLDSFARQFLWNGGLDYAHGTGHGVGAYLYVHEPPIGISHKPLPDDPGLDPGMFLSNEPGYYEDGKFGIRLEDVVLVVEAKTPHNYNDRKFLTFETVTYCPKQTKLVQVDLLTDEELDYLNAYHKRCRDLLGPILGMQEQVAAKEWLLKETAPLLRK